MNTALVWVAEAAALEEGEVGVRDILSAVADLEPASVRAISRRTGIAVPAVAATLGELRKVRLVDTGRPARLTPRGREVVGARSVRDEDPLPAWLLDVAVRLATLGPHPAVDPSLDQSHCTLATRLRRAERLASSGDLLFLGDDDLTSVAVAVALAPRRVVVVDVDERVLATIGEQAPGVEVVAHDLRDPLPEALCGAFDTVFTDPPYTVPGAGLFLSRAAEALRPGPGRAVLWCFGPKGPDAAVDAQATVVGMGFEIERLERNFNEYVGAGVIGSTSHLYQLRSASQLRPTVTRRYDGPLYTRQVR